MELTKINKVKHSYSTTLYSCLKKNELWYVIMQ